MKKSEFICLIWQLLAPMQNLEGGSQRGDDPEKSSPTADGAAKPRQKCLTVHDETWARNTHCFVKDYHYRCFRHSWKNVPLGFFYFLLIFVTLIWQGEIRILPFRCCQLTFSKYADDLERGYALKLLHDASSVFFGSFPVVGVAEI